MLLFDVPRIAANSLDESNSVELEQKIFLEILCLFVRTLSWRKKKTKINFDGTPFFSENVSHFRKTFE